MGEDRIPTMPQVDEERIPTMPQADTERIPTMPQQAEGEGRIPTMPQQAEGEGRIPTMPQQAEGEERIPTMPQQAEGEERIPTVPQGQQGADGRIATVPQQSVVERGNRNRNLVVNADIRFQGAKGTSFVIESGHVISADSGESQIYGCHKLIGDEKFAARVLLSVRPDSEREKRSARDKVIQFLDAVSRKEDSHILPLIDHGTINSNGKDYFVEIYPFCEEGDLGRRKGQISYAELHDEIIPAINEALHLFHNAGFVHRDVKPDNLYRYHGQVVIGDFGITCDLRADGFATDKFKTGTLGYYAPELMSQAAIKASDYYSFGQTIWTLYSGEMMYRNILRRYKEFGIDEQRNQINFAMLNNVYYGLDEIKAADAFFEILIRGLLQYDPSSRFGYEQVKRWIDGDKSVAHDIAKFDSKDIFTTPFKYNGKECWDNSEIYEALVKDWENAKELLYSGVLKDFYVSQDFGIASEIDKIVKRYSTVVSADGHEVPDEVIDVHNDVGLSRFFMLLNKGVTLVWRGTKYHNFGGLSEHIRIYLKSINTYKTSPYFDDLLGSELLGYWYQYQTSKNHSYDEGMAECIDTIRSLAGEKSAWRRLIAYTTTYYVFAGNSEAVQFRKCKTLDEIAKYMISIKQNVYENWRSVLARTTFYGFLFATGYGEYAKYMVKNLQNGRTVADVEMLYELFDGEIKDPKLRRELLDYYVQRGPYAHLYWWKNHLGMYEYHSEEANALRAEIENVRLEGANINDYRQAFEQLDRLAIKFSEKFVNNIFLAQMGLNQGKSEITSEKAEAYWHYNFLEREAPVGFRAYIEEGGDQHEV